MAWYEFFKFRLFRKGPVSERNLREVRQSKHRIEQKVNYSPPARSGGSGGLPTPFNSNLEEEDDRGYSSRDMYNLQGY